MVPLWLAMAPIRSAAVKVGSRFGCHGTNTYVIRSMLRNVHSERSTGCTSLKARHATNRSRRALLVVTAMTSGLLITGYVMQNGSEKALDVAKSPTVCEKPLGEKSLKGIQEATRLAPPPFVMAGQKWMLSSFYMEGPHSAMSEYLPVGQDRSNWSEMIVSVVEPDQEKSLRRHMKDMWKSIKSQTQIVYWQVVEEAANEILFEYCTNSGSEYHIYRMIESVEGVTVYCYSKRIPEDATLSSTENKSETIELAANNETRARWAILLKSFPANPRSSGV
eukprot:CFRG4351T1